MLPRSFIHCRGVSSTEAGGCLLFGTGSNTGRTLSLATALGRAVVGAPCSLDTRLGGVNRIGMNLHGLRGYTIGMSCAPVISCVSPSMSTTTMCSC